MKMLNKLSCFGIPTTALLLLISACVAHGSASTIYETGFESPGFTTGPLNGQSGWFVAGSAALTSVENTVVYEGLQAVSVAANPTTLDGGAHDVAATISTGSVLTVSDYANFSATGSPNYWTPISAYFVNGGQINVNVDRTGQLVLSIDGTNTNTGVYASTGFWNQFTMVLNYSSDTVTAYYDGSEIEAAQPFSPNDDDLSFTAIYTQATSGSPSQLGYFDNLAVTVSAPEPNTFFYLLGAGVLLVVVGASQIRSCQTPMRVWSVAGKRAT